MVDGQFLPDRPIDLLAQGNYKTDVNLLASTVEDEGSFIFALMFPQFRNVNPEPLELDQAKKVFFDYLSNHYLKGKTIPKELIDKYYFSGLNSNLDDQNLYRKRTTIALGDVILGCPTLEFAKHVFKNAPNTAKVYQWYYKAKLGNNKLICSKWAGTCHCDDLYPVFGIPFRQPDQYLDRERDISNEVINFIKSFIRTG